MRKLIGGILSLIAVFLISRSVVAQSSAKEFNLVIIPAGQAFQWNVHDPSGFYVFRATPVYMPQDPQKPGMHVIGSGYNLWDIFKTQIKFDIYVNIAAAETNFYPNFLSVTPPRGVFVSSNMTNKSGPYLLVFIPMVSR